MAKIKRSRRFAASISKFEVIGQNTKINSEIKKAISKHLTKKERQNNE
jgi:hypothetical protein